MKTKMKTNQSKRDTTSARALLLANLRGYAANKHGEVIAPRGNKLKLLCDRQGYLYFNFRLPGENPTHVYVHRLLALQKYGLRVFNPLFEVMHRDQNKQNNHLENIGIGTHKENCNDTPKYLLEHPERRHAVCCVKGKIINYYPSIYAASKNSGVNRGSISNVLNGKGKTAGGLQWFRWFKMHDSEKFINSILKF